MVVNNDIGRCFENELGNEITMEIVHDERGVTVYASGPTSEVEHTWTLKEAENLCELLNIMFGKQVH